MFNCLSEAKRTQFLTGKRFFFAIFHEKRQILVHTNAVMLSCLTPKHRTQTLTSRDLNQDTAYIPQYICS